MTSAQPASLVAVPLRDMTITATTEQWIAVKPVCEAIGIAFNGQFERLNRQAWATVRMTRTVAEDGKTREMYCIDRRTFTMWLATIDASRVKDPAARDRIGIFQTEAADALDRYFHTGEAIRTPQTMQEALRAYADALDAKAEVEAELAAISPKAHAWDDLASGVGDYSITDAAKTLARAGIATGPRKLHAQMQELGWIFKDQKGKWAARQDRLNDGCLAERVRSYIDDSGVTTLASPQVRITARGIERLRSVLVSSTQTLALS